MVQRILCVCLGNICRSPTAEAVLRKHLPNVMIDSAGTGGWHVGAAPYAPMQTAAQARGYDLSLIRARQIKRSDFKRFDLILAMDRQNHADLTRIAPGDTATKIALFRDPVGGGDVPDPYYTRDFEQALDLIETAAEAWMKRLRLQA